MGGNRHRDFPRKSGLDFPAQNGCYALFNGADDGVPADAVVAEA